MRWKLHPFEPTAQAMIASWHRALADPEAAQQATLERLLAGYAQTEYGDEHGAEKVSSIADYRHSFPIVTYADLRPTLDRVMAGHWSALLTEPPVAWGLTRGTTGKSKFIPMTASGLKLRGQLAPRALLSYLLRTGRWEILEGYCLSQTFPSVLGHLTVEGKRIPYGYSSGLYSRYTQAESPIRSVPSQEEIDELGGGTDRASWEHRFELVYQRAKDERVTMLIGVTQTMLHFGRWLRRTYHLLPRHVWPEMALLIGTSMVGIQTTHAPALRALYDPEEILEMYGATEGLFAQQLDERPYVSPNYDVFLFEVETRRGLKMLYELRPGEYGSLIVSTPDLPRYRIGDVVLSFGEPYYRCIGRERPLAYWRYRLRSLLDGELLIPAAPGLRSAPPGRWQ